MDVMGIRRGIIASMIGIKLPNNVKVKTFTIESNTAGTGNFTIENPYGNTNFSNCICINFADTSSLTGSYCIGFIVNPSTIGDNSSDRKLSYVFANHRIETTNFTAIESITSESITLRNNGTYNWLAGTYFMFTW
ncbi:MAG: hypothetical protein IIZ68_06560 [Clostridia bacterium]|nr:hypothetical protein [Clostridia bacterium]